MQREPVYSALFALIDTLRVNGVVKSASRRLLHWNDVPLEDQPAIFMAQGDQTPERKSWDLPPGWNLFVNVYIYVAVPDGEAPAPVLNAVLDALEAALTPTTPNNLLTLNGLCKSCFIADTIETFEGTLGSQEVAIVPIVINVR